MDVRACIGIKDEKPHSWLIRIPPAVQSAGKFDAGSRRRRGGIGLVAENRNAPNALLVPFRVDLTSGC
jgi:hypothetical protein